MKTFAALEVFPTAPVVPKCLQNNAQAGPQHSLEGHLAQWIVGLTRTSMNSNARCTELTAARSACSIPSTVTSQPRRRKVAASSIPADRLLLTLWQCGIHDRAIQNPQQCILRNESRNMPYGSLGHSCSMSSPKDLTARKSQSATDCCRQGGWHSIWRQDLR